MTRANKPPVALYSALADVTRCQILQILKAGPVPVHRLSDSFSISRPAISRHLRVLKQAGLVAEVKKGRENLYAFKPRRLVAAQDWLDRLAAAAASVAVSNPDQTEASQPPQVVRAPERPVVPAPAMPPEQPVDIVTRRSRATPPTRSQGPSISQMGFDF